jgi:hypothetical protein
MFIYYSLACLQLLPMSMPNLQPAPFPGNSRLSSTTWSQHTALRTCLLSTPFHPPHKSAKSHCSLPITSSSRRTAITCQPSPPPAPMRPILRSKYPSYLYAYHRRRRSPYFNHTFTQNARTRSSRHYSPHLHPRYLSPASLYRI